MSEVATPGARHALYSVLEEVLGHEHADTLMTYLPTQRSEEVATKGDIARLEQRFDRMEDTTREEFRELRSQLAQWQRTTLISQAAMLTAATAIFSAIALFFT